MKTLSLTFILGFLMFPSALLAQITPQSLRRTVDLYDRTKLPSRGGGVDWGLALSGGGIRSGSYSIGVMKALYDAGLMRDIDVISTVSGGGFAAYWLYGQNDAWSSATFGQGALSDEVYLQRTCSVHKFSQMYTRGDMFKALFRSKAGAFEKYADSIHNTFGQNNNALLSKKLSSYRSKIENKEVPYLIINATMSTPTLKEVGASVEMTPFHLGNPLLGFASWNDAASEPTFRDAVATSAAGIEMKLRQSVPNFSPRVLETQNKHNGVYLYDGGCSENLGALGLIRRGIPNVIIVDAEHDPKYQFESYTRLKESLKRMDIDLSVPDIEPRAIKADQLVNACPVKYFKKAERDDFRPNQALMMGTAFNRSTNETTRIYYLKMSRSKDIFAVDLEKQIMRPTRPINSEERNALIQRNFEKGFQIAKVEDDKVKTYTSKTEYTSDCSKAGGTKIDLDALYSYRVNRYGYYVLSRETLKLAAAGGDFFAYDFPQTTTFDQSYYPDQMEAFMGLGYLQGRTLARQLLVK